MLLTVAVVMAQTARFRGLNYYKSFLCVAFLLSLAHFPSIVLVPCPSHNVALKVR